jgi:tRNA pseudouridine55 synthase
VYGFQELWRELAPEPGVDARAGYEIECGSGTYVRSLIADLHDAYCLALRRTAIGPFDVRDAVAPPARDQRWADPPLIALDRALALAARPSAGQARQGARTMGGARPH